MISHSTTHCTLIASYKADTRVTPDVINEKFVWRGYLLNIEPFISGITGSLWVQIDPETSWQSMHMESFLCLYPNNQSNRNF